jgi:hypothetical protein
MDNQLMPPLDIFSEMLVQLEEARKKIEAPIVEWLKEQGIEEFDSRIHNIILPMHIKELFTLDIPEWIVFSEYCPEFVIYRVDKGYEDDFQTLLKEKNCGL